MIARKIRPGEYRRCQQLCALAFEYEMKDAGLSPEALLKKVQDNPRSMQDAHWDSQYAAFMDDDETMLATMTVVPWTANFDGHAVSMGGIGGVASLPQHRRADAPILYWSMTTARWKAGSGWRSSRCSKTVPSFRSCT